jgi:hypothetical protein
MPRSRIGRGLWYDSGSDVSPREDSMRNAIRTAALVTTALVLPAMVAASSDSIVTAVELERALTAQSEAEQQRRASIKRLLARDAVRALAEGQGLDLRQAGSAVEGLSGEDLERLAAQAAAVESELGGAQVIRIDVVVLLLIIIIIILLAK